MPAATLAPSANAAESLAHAQGEVRRTLRLTERWTPLMPHPMQAAYFWHPARFKINPSGRRSGKTELAKRKGVLELTRRRPWHTKILYGAPTWGQAKDIFWPDLLELIPRHWIAKVNGTDLEITTRWGASIRVMGFDRPRRMEGVPWDDVFVDEIADCPRGAFAYSVRPALSTLGREGRCTLLGVPDEIGRNQAEYEQLWEDGLLWNANPKLAKDSNLCSFHWISEDILAADEIKALKSSYDDLAYEQEFGGRFVTSGGKALPRFDFKTHVRDSFCTYDPRLPLDWTLDFGTAPAASLLLQSYKGHVWVMDEIVLKDSSTDVAADEMFRRANARGYSLRRLRVFGDAAGKSHHSNVGTTDYEILEEKLRGLPAVEWLQLEAAPLVKDSLNSVRGRVCSADRQVRLHIHPRCQNLIKDCKTASWPDGSNNLRAYHCLAALRYYCFALWGAGETTLETAPMSHPNLGGRRK